MICAEFYKKKGNYVGFCISGHAEFAEFGQDVICASVSSAVMLACNLLTENFGFSADVSLSENKISLSLNSHEDSAYKILTALFTHLEIISSDYLDNVKIIEKNL